MPRQRPAPRLPPPLALLAWPPSPRLCISSSAAASRQANVPLDGMEDEVRVLGGDEHIGAVITGFNEFTNYFTLARTPPTCVAHTHRAERIPETVAVDEQVVA